MCLHLNRKMRLRFVVHAADIAQPIGPGFGGVGTEVGIGAGGRSRGACIGFHADVWIWDLEVQLLQTVSRYGRCGTQRTLTVMYAVRRNGIIWTPSFLPTFSFHS
jgi:hypothetical protein